MKRVYYAHPMSTYGTQVELGDLSSLQNKFETVINPNTPSFQQAVKRQKAACLPVMQPFIDAIHSADAVAYRPFPNGKIGAGIAQEVLEGILFGKLILRLPQMTPELFHTSEILSVSETREANKIFGQPLTEASALV